MSDFSEELKGPVTDDEEVETSVLSGAGMHFPWLQTYVETVAIGGKRRKDFAQTTSACLSFIQEALLKHQWQQAAEYMYSYFQTLEDSDSYKRQAAPEISLQHALYLLHHGMLKDAKRNLSEAETWRHGENTSSREILINLIQAYKGLLQYYTWSEKKMELSKLDKDDYAYNAVAQDVFNHSWKTSANISALIKIPGVWDPFVKSYVEMLEFYGDRDGAQEVLTNYAYDEKFPSNPNAHIYLYNFLKRQKAPRSKLISVLKILYQIVPSHKLMLEFHTLLRKSEKEEHRKLGLEVLFGVLDFAGCTKNITAWKYLAKYLKNILMGNHLAWVQEEWNSRKNWWPGFHFSYFWAKSDWKEDTALACEKAFVAGLLLGKGCRYFRYILKQDHQILGKKIKRMKRSVKKYSIVNPRL
ncbi:TATA box-binding protein-associated factor RNA polymerase I subunit A isoform X1 [Homo sapiens]|nr:TATA box-binding protein-associated factor RNA polymerase I subunit A isoform X1 [Homo sapiens]XP_054195463.1 TATA box-binding protein-associated factor RNA polymerase I subunit A isoform X1 [Homo sapiens]XP_054195464.1 TATA box-binding protein-associated factor RNA polymerase I subunit A isoform X1 [Homo sapiens]|eukprot:XP_006711675.1 TATA box-binding protein-associated factor RNA polymerase I subunit A isoform X1 [Homo sapiens]